MSQTLTKASNELMTRPADERYESLTGLHAAVLARKESSQLKVVPYSALSVRAVGEGKEGQPMLVGPGGNAVAMTNWSFGQLAARVHAPASYLAVLSAGTAALALNEGLEAMRVEASVDGEEREAQLLFARNGDWCVRALTSTKYTRIWDADVTSRLVRLSSEHPEWQPAPAAFDGSRGLYAGDRDIFAFLVDNGRRIFEKQQEGGLSRGFFVWNSEVGAASFGIMTFLYEYVCGNHRVWGAEGVKELRLRHVGNADDRAFGALAMELREYAEASAEEDEGRIVAAKRFVLGANKDEVLDKVFGLRVAGLSRKLITSGYDRAEQHDEWYGDPKSAWGFTGGLTEVARELPNADARVAVERAAGKVMELAF